MREMKDSGIAWIGSIPTAWKVGRLKNIKADKQYSIVDGPFGSAISTNDYQDNGIPLVRIVNLSGKYVDSSSTVFISETLANEVKRSSFGLGDIIIAKTGATVGKCSINDSISYGILSSSCIKISVSEQNINRFYYYLFQTKEFNTALREASGGSTRDTINLTPFNNLYCIIPPVTEQQRIANYLDLKCADIDNVIEKTKSSIEDYKKLRQSAITEAVTKGVRGEREMKNSGIIWVGEMPNTWSRCSISYISSSRSGGTPNRDEPSYWENGTIPWMSSGEVNKEYVWETNEKITQLGSEHSSAKKLSPNCVMVALNGQGKTKGMSAILKIEAACNQSLCAIKCDDSVLFYEYLFYCFKAMYKHLRSQAGDDLRDGLSASFVVKQVIPIPSREEQQEIASYLNQMCAKIDSLINKKERFIKELETYRKSLIYEYVTGKTEVK